jgi:hypothetical protein
MHWCRVVAEWKAKQQMLMRVQRHIADLVPSVLPLNDNGPLVDITGGAVAVAVAVAVSGTVAGIVAVSGPGIGSKMVRAGGDPDGR